MSDDPIYCVADMTDCFCPKVHFHRKENMQLTVRERRANLCEECRYHETEEGK